MNPTIPDRMLLQLLVPQIQRSFNPATAIDGVEVPKGEEKKEGNELVKGENERTMVWGPLSDEDNEMDFQNTKGSQQIMSSTVLRRNGTKHLIDDKDLP